MNVKDLAIKYQDYAVKMRREFHMNPETSMKEFNTQKRLTEELEKIGLRPVKSGGTGLVAIIKGKGQGKTIALRADMDALEIEETNDTGYKSKTPGMMHACGHDGHMASLLTAAKILVDMKDEFRGNVKLVFQPGEETSEGALAMIKDNVLDGVDGAFGIHIWNDIKVGKVSIEAGPRMASVGKFEIFVTGKGGHGSLPNQGVDAVVVASAIIMNLQTITSREILPSDPAVVSVGMVKAGTRWNVIAGDAYMKGTTRCFSRQVSDGFEEQITRIAENTAKSYRAKSKVEYTQLAMPTINDPMMSEIGEGAVRKIAGEDAIIKFEKSTIGEDFSFFSDYCPTTFAFVGSQNVGKIPYFPHHHPKFDIDEDALRISSSLYAQYAIDFLNK